MSCYASTVIKLLETEVGYLEKASNKDLYLKTGNAGSANYTKYAYEMDNKYPKFFNGPKNGYAWCAVFVTWGFVSAFGEADAHRLLCQPEKSIGAGCSYAVRYFKNNGRFYTSPKVGDQIFFNDSTGDPCHTGLVYAVDNTYVYTIEGNTSSTAGVVANGGCVAKKKYLKTYSRIYGYGRPDYDAELVKSAAPKVVAKTTTKVNAKVKAWQLAAIADGFKFPKYGADGEWGSECESVLKKAVLKRQFIYTKKNLTKFLQKQLGIEADGKFGPKTLEAVKKYQKSNGLDVDGSVGPKTWKKILGV